MRSPCSARPVVRCRNPVRGPIRTLFPVLLTLGLTEPALAAPDDFTGLNCATTIITGTEDPERSRGIVEVFEEVAVKMSGDEEGVASNRIAEPPDGSAALIERIELEDRMKGIPVHDEQGTRERPHFLRVCFDRDKMAALLQASGSDVWPEPRPEVRIVLAVETPNAAYIVRREGADGYGQRLALIDTATKRGLPIRLPTDEDHASEARDIARFVETGQIGKKGATPTLYGTLTLNADGADWNAAWRLDDGEAWRVDEVSFDDAIREGIGGAIDRLRTH
ncbi:DUF2066 domain-containing protein [Notoacmeibacter marinus]|uniref:DUF2066 domain-containing protein n=1 Tax=Notoacmeibacter marinus TaxID=1876515 RepID=UPI0013B05F80|nr:DUF2066 domain-containing protein [Notoacmeibacter marinus]